jgi:hypothetical protein
VRSPFTLSPATIFLPIILLQLTAFHGANTRSGSTRRACECTQGQPGPPLPRRRLNAALLQV